MRAVGYGEEWGGEEVEEENVSGLGEKKWTLGYLDKG